MNTTLRWLSLLGLALVTAVPALAQGDKLVVQARFEPAVARAGETVKLILTASTTPGWHAYGTSEESNIPVALDHGKIEFAGLEPAGEPEIPPGEAHEVFGMMQYPLPGQFEVSQAVKVPAGTNTGAITVEGTFDYQVCNENSCDPPAEAAFAATLTIESGDVRAEYSGAAPTADPAAPPTHGTKPGLVLDLDKLTLRASFEPAVARPGETVKLVLQATTVPGYHAYGSREEDNVPISLDHGNIQFGGLEPVGAPNIPPGEEKEVFGAIQYPLPATFEVTQAVKVPDGTEPGDITIAGMLDYQVCDEDSCDPPAEAPFSAKLTIEAGEARAEYSGDAIEPDNTKKKGGPFDSWWALIIACIGGGLFALAMPCTYPMIPITFSFFTKQAEKRNGNVLGLALMYGLGIISMFVLVGVALSKVIIPFVNHWGTNLFIAAIFLLFSMVLFGWINLNPPRFVQNAAGKASQTGGLLGVFFMGATLVIASFTCTAPIVGSLIANVAQYGSLRVGIGMAIFGLTMAIPFVVLSLMPTKVKAMPRSGEWMETLKVSLGFVELAAVLKFMSVVDLSLGWAFLNRELFLLLTAVIFLLWAMYLFGYMRKAGEPVVGVGAGRQATGMFVVLFAAYLMTGAMGHRLDFYVTSFAPPYSAEFVTSHQSSETKAKGHTIVYDNEAKAIEVAKAEDKLLLYNFTGFN